MKEITCTQARAWFDGVDRAPAENAAFEDHIVNCAACRELLIEAEKPAVDPARILFAERHPMRTDERSTAEMPTVITPDEFPFLDPPEQPGGRYRIGHYEIIRVLGTGAMGIVFLALDTRLRSEVALKVMKPDLAENPRARELFVREAQAAARLNHPHVVTVLAVEDAHNPPYLVMKTVRGPTLAQWLATNPRPSLAAICAIAVQLAQALAAAHQAGVVHRDIKPGNILVEEPSADGLPSVKIADFGLAAVAEGGDLARTGIVAGTAAYMAPEQARGGPVDYRADLFSLGSVLYEMCTGRKPFQGDGVLAVLDQVKTATPPPIRKANPTIPAWFERIVAHLHAKRPEARYQSAADVARDIENERNRTRGGRPGILTLVSSVAALLLVALAAVWWFQPPESANERLTRLAWEAYTARDYPTVLVHADECIREFRGDAARLQQKLADENAPEPPVGVVSADVRKGILTNGLLNDVATCLWLKGRAHEGLGQRDEARKIYEQARMLTYARCYDLAQNSFFAPALKAVDDLKNLDESAP